MKKIVFLIFVFFILTNAPFLTKASDYKNLRSENDQVMVIEEFQNMFEWGDMYLSGQPSLDALEWIKEQDVSLIINLRTEDEMLDFKQTAFDEEKIVNQLGIGYVTVPVGGENGYSPENLLKFNEVLSQHNGKVLIHCRSCGRVTYFLMAYLVKYKEYSLDDAIVIGKQLKFSFPLENLLGQEIAMGLK